MQINTRFLAVAIVISLFSAISGYSQGKFTPILLPNAISGINEEFSGMALWENRLYLEPQYGDFKETKLDGKFNIYSILADSIGRVIDGRDKALSQYRAIKVLNLNKLPDSVKKHYEGFEALSIVNKQVYLSIETTDTYAYCFILKGVLDTVKNEISIDASHYVTLKRQIFISNAGFESVTYLPTENKLLAYYEFNALPNGGTGYLIDTAFKNPPQKIAAPFLYFRITDIASDSKGQVFGINYYWDGDYDHYLNNEFLSHQESLVKTAVPYLKDSLNRHPDYLKRKTFARIVKLNSYKDKQWKQVATFEGYKNNWEGIALYRQGALIVTDANRSTKQLTTFGYVAF